MFIQNRFVALLIMVICSVASLSVWAQNDSARKLSIDSLLLKRKGIIHNLAQNIFTDSSKNGDKEYQRNDLPFYPYEGLIIRHIIIQSLDFGVSINDTTKKLSNKLIKVSNSLHHKTRDFVILNNLFFAENQPLSPYLVGANERYLRDLPYFQDARIIARPADDSPDSVDIIVLTKDVLSIGGSLNMRDQKSGDITAKEDNLYGWGDRLQFQALYDQSRYNPFGYGFEYIRRNIGGSFIDGSAGYVNFNKSFNSGRTDDRTAFVRVIRPLVNPYMLWTYAVNAEIHSTYNMFYPDSVYQSDWKFKYKMLDAWAGLNLSTKKTYELNEYQRSRWLVSLRAVDQHFLDKPAKYLDHYNYSFADVTAILGSLSVFKQNFYKTQYIYGFGRNEDLPEGLEASFTTGWTKKDGRVRPYSGLDFQRYYFTHRKAYYNYIIRAGGYVYNNRLEDVNVLASIDYLTRLHRLSSRWKQRMFLNASYARQFNYLLNEPLYVESQYGLNGFKNDYIGGDVRASARAESVFFSPWNVLYFKFAPFAFTDATYFRFNNGTGFTSKLFSSIGGGIRTRNESLIFGTIELKGYYFPTRDFFNRSWKIEINTNVRFKYNQEFIKRPDFVQIN